jgi:hypothetical protein
MLAFATFRRIMTRDAAELRLSQLSNYRIFQLSFPMADIPVWPERLMSAFHAVNKTRGVDTVADAFML